MSFSFMDHISCPCITSGFNDLSVLYNEVPRKSINDYFSPKVRTINYSEVWREVDCGSGCSCTVEVLEAVMRLRPSCNPYTRCNPCHLARPNPLRLLLRAARYRKRRCYCLTDDSLIDIRRHTESGSWKKHFLCQENVNFIGLFLCGHKLQNCLYLISGWRRLCNSAFNDLISRFYCRASNDWMTINHGW